MELIVKPAELKDSYLIYQVNQEAFSAFTGYYPNGIVPALSESPQEIGEDIRNKVVLVAWYGENLVGSIRYHYLNQDTAYISRFAVSNKFQKLGIGKKLLESVIEMVQNEHGYNLTLHANYQIKPVLDFYLRNEFEIEKISYEKGYPRVTLTRVIGRGVVNYEIMERQICL